METHFILEHVHCSRPVIILLCSGFISEICDPASILSLDPGLFMVLLRVARSSRAPPGDPVDVGAWPLWRPVNGASDQDTMRHGQPREFCLIHVDAPPVTSDQDAHYH